MVVDRERIVRWRPLVATSRSSTVAKVERGVRQGGRGIGVRYGRKLKEGSTVV